MSQWSHYSEPDAEFEEKRSEFEARIPPALKSVDEIPARRVARAKMIAQMLVTMEIPSKRSHLNNVKFVSECLSKSRGRSDRESY